MNSKRLIALLLSLITCLSLAACSEPEDKFDVDEEIRITVQARAAAYCVVNYKDVKNVLASITTTDETEENTYEVKGYITVIDDYNDKYKAKFTATVEIDLEEEDGSCTDFDMDKPVKEG